MGEARVLRDADGAVHEGVPWVFKANGRQTGGRFDFMVGEVPYLSGPPLHTHRDQEDTFYVLEGVLTVQAGDEVVELAAGDFVSIPPGVPHTFDNLRAGQTVRAINIMTPGGFDEFMIEQGRAGQTPAEREAILRLAEEHGVTRVGPPLREHLGLG